MTKRKLILICQTGGKFVTNDDGSLSYIDGDAHAVDIHSETMFEDLQLKLGETLNLDYETLTIKYFLPKNTKTLITLSHDKDLKRMIDFHGDSVTADVFVSGKKGFKCKAVNKNINSGSKKKPAKVVQRNKISQSTTPVTQRSSNSSQDTSDDDSSYGDLTHMNPVSITDDKTIDIPMDMDCTPADTVKKRRRTASWKYGSNGFTIVGVPENIADKKETISCKKKTHNMKNATLAEDNQDMDIVYDEDDSDTLADHEIFEEGSLESMVVSWKHGIKGVDQDFSSVVEFRDALQKYAIAHRFMYKYKKNEAARVSGGCVIEGCPWRIYASWVPSAEVFRIKTLVKTHTCGGKSWKSAHPAKKWLVNVIKDKLRVSPDYKPKDIAKSIYKDFGIELNYSQVWRSVEDAKEQLQGSFRESYNQLPWLCEKIRETNPGSIANFMTNDEKRLQSVFISFHAIVNGFQNGCRPLLFLDSMSLKSKYEEKLMVATGVDAYDGFFPVAFAIVDKENDQNWVWFLDQLKSAVTTSRSITFVSDREKGLPKFVLDIFKNAHHGYSMYHLLESFKKNLKGPFLGDGRNVLPGSFLAASRAIRVDGFKKFTEQIKQVSSTAYDWVMQIEPECWTSSFSNGEPHNDFLVRVSEFYTKVIEESRELNFIKKIESLIHMMIELIENSRVLSTNWSTMLTPCKEVKLQEEIIRTVGLKVLFSSDTLFEVHGDSINVVNLEKKDCSCLEWKVTGLPCRHAIAVFNCKGMNVYDYCSKYFTVDSFCLTYMESINPLPNQGKLMEKDDDVSEIPDVSPPFISGDRRKKEREKKERVLKRIIYCTKCKESGHNKATCKSDL